MDETTSEEFDIDAGVADIADSMGFNKPKEEEQSDDYEQDDDGLQEDTDEAVEDSGEKEQDLERNDQTTESKQPPKSWAKDQHDTWLKLPPEAQNYIELREKQMLDGIEQYKDGYHYAGEVVNVIDQYRADIQGFNIPDHEIIGNLLSHHRAITQGTLEQRQQAFLQIGLQSGLIPQDGIDENTRQLQERVARMESAEQQRIRQMQQEEARKVQQSVETFASDPKNKYFDEVADDLIKLLRAGEDLPSAYEKAVWANPVTRAKEIAAQQDAQRQRAREDAEKAKKAAGANIRPSQSGRTPSVKAKSWEETMWGIINAQKN